MQETSIYNEQRGGGVVMVLMWESPTPSKPKGKTNVMRERRRKYDST
jgi:hypothetical protein